MAKFEKGKNWTGNKKGCPKGAHHIGRSPDWLKTRCEEIFEKRNLVEFLGQVAGGDEVDFTVTSDGSIVRHAANIKARLQAIEMLKDWRWGKATQDVRHSGEIEHRIINIIRSKEKHGSS